MTVLIFANGEMKPGPWVLPFVNEASYIIAADGGARHLEVLEIRPNLIIGDLDSSDPELLSSFVQSGTKTIEHPADKDETDLELALLYAKDNFDEPVLVFGAVGGRVDHTLANLLLLAHPQLIDQEIYFVSKGRRLWLVNHRSLIFGQSGDIVSFIPIKGSAEIKSTKGLRWPIENEELEFGKPRGISNEMTESKAEIEIDSGAIICVHIARELYELE